MDIVSYIPRGRKYAITKEELCRRTGLTDRAVRNLIRRARDQGAPIISSSHAAGYYLAETDSEREILRRDLLARVKSMLQTYWAVEHGASPADQMTITELLGQ